MEKHVDVLECLNINLADKGVFEEVASMTEMF